MAAMTCPVSDLSIAVLGCGFMGTAILKGLLDSISPTDFPKLQCVASVQSQASLQRLQRELGADSGRVVCARNNFAEAAAQANVIVLGVPPGELTALLQNEGMATAMEGKLIVSLLAGVSCGEVLDALAGTRAAGQPGTYHVVRVIPSIGAKNRDSVSLIADSVHAGEEQRNLCIWIFKQIGWVQVLPERLLTDATAVGAACNALAFIAVDAIVDGSVAEGVPRPVASALAAQSLRSAAALMSAGTSPETLKEAMSVPLGITINSAITLERGHVRSAVSEAVMSAIRYARDMPK